MKISTTTALLSAAALTFGLAACGGDDEGGAAGSPLAEALATEIMAESESSPVGSEEEATCWANKIVGEIGEDRLAELGMTEDDIKDVEDYDFTAEEMSTLVDAMFSCVDVKAAFAAEFEEQFGADGAKCLADELDEDLVKEAMLADQNGGEPSAEFMQAFIDIAAECDLDLGGA